jgi:hypothetical protein
MTTHAGSCHCGKIAFDLEGDFASAIVCNCSYCRRTGNVLAFTSPENFTLKTPQKDASTYLFNKQVITHYHCANCGVSTHGSGVGPDGKRSIAVNLRCVEDIDLDALKIQKFDGAKL